MCYNVRTSLLSYSLGLSSGIFALYTKQIILGIFILVYSQIQLGEAIIWKSIDNNNNKLNEIGTAFLKYMLTLHNIGLSIGIIMENKNRLSFNHFVPLFLSILFFGYVVCYEYATSHKRVTFPKKICKLEQNKCDSFDNRLVWPFPHEWWYVMSFILSTILFIIYNKSIYSSIFIMGTYLLTYGLTKIIYKGKLSTLFCMFSALLSPFIVGVNLYIN